MTPRALLLAATSAVGLLVARALDGMGLLPGVKESAAVRSAALDLRWNALGILGCLVLGAVGAKLLPRAAVLSATVLVGGQVALVMSLEESGRALSGATEIGGSGSDTGLWVATAVQVLLVVLSLTTALLVLALVPPVLAVRAWPGLVRVAGASAYRVVLSQAPVGGQRGRAPPAGSR